MSNKTLTTNKLIHLIKLKGSIPESSVSFTENDFLYFINEELDLGVVPHIMSFHQDYLLYTEAIQLESGITRYEIPSRAVGNKLRDITFVSGQSYYEMTRIQVEDLADRYNFFQGGNLRKFYIEGNEIVVSPELSRDSGHLNVSYYMRPNAVVSENDTAVVTSVNLNNGIVSVDKIPDVFSDNTQFDIISSRSSFRLLAKETIPDGIANSNSLAFTFGTTRKASYALPVYASIPSSSYIKLIDNSTGTNDLYVFWFDKTGTDIAPVVAGANLVRLDCSACVTTQDAINVFLPLFNSAFVDNRLIASINTSSSFYIENGGLAVSVGNNFTVSGQSVSLVQTVVTEGSITIPARLGKNDIIALPEESSIPQIPVELQALLAQRSTMRCLESLGDMAGLQAAAAKLADMEAKTGMILNNRVESSPLKILPRHTTFKRNTNKNDRGF